MHHQCAECKARKERVLTIDWIMDLVSDHFCIPLHILISKNRKPEMVDARNCIVWLARKYTALNYRQIGSKLAGRHYSTIMFSEKTMNDRMETADPIKQHIEDLDEICMHESQRSMLKIA